MNIFASQMFTLLHVAISIAGIASGGIVLASMIGNRPLGLSNSVFLITTIATTVTGFLFPIKSFDPALGVGIVSAIALGIAVWALYPARLQGAARPAYAAAATFALYLNVFVAIVQAFQKIPFLRGPDPTQPPAAFIVCQGTALIGFGVAGYLATKHFHPTGSPKHLTSLKEA